MAIIDKIRSLISGSSTEYVLKDNSGTQSSHKHTKDQITDFPVIPEAANNGTLTIQKNGTNVAQFGANSASDVTANISVPTALSELSTDTTHRVVTDIEKSTWNNKAPTNHASTATTYGIGDATNYGHVKVDSALSDTSTNPVQNKVVKAALDGKIKKEAIDLRGMTFGSSDLKNLSIPVDLYDGFWSLDKRFNVQVIRKNGSTEEDLSSSISSLIFDGDNEHGDVVIGDNEQLIVRVTNNDKIIDIGYHIYGYFVVGFYYDKLPASVKLEMLCRGATQTYTWSTRPCTHYGNGTSDVWVCLNLHSVYNCKELKFTIDGVSKNGARNTSVPTIRFLETRTRNDFTPFINKYKPQTLYHDIKAPHFVGKLTGEFTTARNLKVNLASESAQSFNGSANAESIGVSGTLPITHGGTGATTASAARTNLDVYSKGEVNTALSAAIADEAAAREAGDLELLGAMDSKISNHNVSSVSHGDIRNALSSEASTRSDADTALGGRIDSEESDRQQADRELQAQIDAISSKSDVVDVVASYAELVAYDTSTLFDNDVIKVLQDETQDDAESYYRWNETTWWQYIGSQGPFVTPAEMQTALNDKVDKVTGKGLSTNDYTDAEKTKLAGIESGATKTVVDDLLNDTSTNPVQNKVITDTINKGVAISLEYKHTTIAAEVQARAPSYNHMQFYTSTSGGAAYITDLPLTGRSFCITANLKRHANDSDYAYSLSAWMLGDAFPWVCEVTQSTSACVWEQVANSADVPYIIDADSATTAIFDEAVSRYNAGKLVFIRKGVYMLQCVGATSTQMLFETVAGGTNGISKGVIDWRRGTSVPSVTWLNAAARDGSDATGTWGINISGNAATATNATTHINNTSNPHNVTKAQVGLGNVENESVSNGTPDFTEATTRANIASGEKMSTLFGKIKKWFTDLKALAFKDNVSDSDINGTISDSHIASASTWNGKQNILSVTGHSTTTFSDNSTIIVSKSSDSLLTRTALALWNYINDKFINGQSYIPNESGTSGTSGWVNFLDLHTVKNQAQRPLMFICGGRRKPVSLLCIQPANNSSTDYLPSFTEIKMVFFGSEGSYPNWCYTYEDVTEDGAQHRIFHFWGQKNEGYGDVSAFPIQFDNRFTISRPNRFSASKPSGSVTIDNVRLDATSTYSSTGTQAVNGTAVASAISGKAESVHTHTKSQITDFPTALSEFTDDLHDKYHYGSFVTASVSKGYWCKFLSLTDDPSHYSSYPVKIEIMGRNTTVYECLFRLGHTSSTTVQRAEYLIIGGTSLASDSNAIGYVQNGDTIDFYFKTGESGNLRYKLTAQKISFFNMFIHPSASTVVQQADAPTGIVYFTNMMGRIAYKDGSNASGTWGINISGNAATSAKLQNSRNLKVDLSSTGSQSFDGSADATSIGVANVLPLDNGGTGGEGALSARANLRIGGYAYNSNSSSMAALLVHFTSSTTSHIFSVDFVSRFNGSQTESGKIVVNQNAAYLIYDEPVYVSSNASIKFYVDRTSTGIDLWAKYTTTYQRVSYTLTSGAESSTVVYNNNLADALPTTATEPVAVVYNIVKETKNAVGGLKLPVFVDGDGKINACDNTLDVSISGSASSAESSSFETITTVSDDLNNAVPSVNAREKVYYCTNAVSHVPPSSTANKYHVVARMSNSSTRLEQVAYAFDATNHVNYGQAYIRTAYRNDSSSAWTWSNWVRFLTELDVDDSNVVHKTGAETITGQKLFSYSDRDDAIKIKCSTANSGAFISYYSDNQDDDCWRVGSLTGKDKFIIAHNGAAPYNLTVTQDGETITKKFSIGEPSSSTAMNVKGSMQYNSTDECIEFVFP